MHTECNALSLLEFVSTSIIPARDERFVVKDHIVEDVSARAKVKISHIGVGFRSMFLEEGGKTEEPASQIALCAHRQIGKSVDGPLIDFLGGEQRVVVDIGHIFTMMEKQATGRKGDLLVSNHLRNTFFAKNRFGILTTVMLSWYDPGWFIGAVEPSYAQANASISGIGHLIFSRVSHLIPAYGQCQAPS